MRKFSNITILTLSIGLASTPVLARQAVDDYVGYTHGGYTHGAYIPTENVRQKHGADTTTTAEFARGDSNADDRESRRIGKLLWKSDQEGHSKWSDTKMLEWPSLWKSDHVQGELDWPLLWKIGYIQGGHGNVN